jgi:hypothetical protein
MSEFSDTQNILPLRRCRELNKRLVENVHSFYMIEYVFLLPFLFRKSIKRFEDNVWALGLHLLWFELQEIIPVIDATTQITRVFILSNFEMLTV